MSSAGSAPSTTPSCGSMPCFSTSSSAAAPRPRRRAPARSPAAAASPVCSGRAWLKTVTLVTAPPFARRPRGPPARPRDRARRSRRTSRGSPPARAGPRTRSRARTAPSSRAANAPTPTSASRRSSASRTTPPFPTRSRPDLELRLDHREQIEPGRGGAHHRGQHLGQRDERDVGHDQVGRVRQLARIERAGVAALDDRHTSVVPQPPVELAVGHVEAITRRRRAGAGSR